MKKKHELNFRKYRLLNLLQHYCSLGKLSRCTPLKMLWFQRIFISLFHNTIIGSVMKAKMKTRHLNLSEAINPKRQRVWYPPILAVSIRIWRFVNKKIEKLSTWTHSSRTETSQCLSELVFRCSPSRKLWSRKIFIRTVPLCTPELK